MKKAINFVFLFVATLFTFSVSHAQSRSELIALELSVNQLVHLQVLSPSNPKKPTFLLLPGVNRSVLANDPSVVELQKLGYGVAIMNFSTQPFSVDLLEEGVTPYFKTKTLKLSDFVLEVEQVLSYLREQKNIKQLIPVSLSFSAAVSPFLQSVDHVIEVAPLTSSEAANPQLEQYIRTLKSGEIFNPFFGPGITRSTLDSAYRAEWKSAVDEQIKKYDLNPKQKDNMIEGYTSMSRVVELFSWGNIELSPKIRRTFLMGENENQRLKKNQGETVLSLQKKKVPVSAYMIKAAGHVVPSDQPLAFAKALGHAVEVGLPQGSVAEVSASSGQVTVLNEAQALSSLRAVR